MTWTYRIGHNAGDWGIYEVYVDGERVTGVSESSVVPTGESREDLLATLELLLEASRKEPLDIAAVLRSEGETS